MALTVREIMNRELFSLRPNDASADALKGLLSFEVYGAPVVDDAQRPVGVVSLRDLVAKQGASVAERMSSPAVVVRLDSRITDAAKLIAETGYRRLVVVDAENRTVGMLSAVDVIRGLIGAPVQHPAAFPHLDPITGVPWTDDTAFDLEKVNAAPNGPGVLVLVHSVAGSPDLMVWVESTNNVQTRLFDLLSLPQESFELNRLLEQRKNLRFRASAVPDRSLREQVAERLRPQTRNIA